MKEQKPDIPFDPDFDQADFEPVKSNHDKAEKEEQLVIKFRLDRQTIFDGLTVIIFASLIYFGWQINSLMKFIK